MARASSPLSPKPRRPFAWTAEGLHLIIGELGSGSEGPLYQALADRIREAVATGRLRPGARLPASRSLAAALGVSRSTVATAFELLQAEGYLRGRVGSGTAVVEDLPAAGFARRLMPPPEPSPPMTPPPPPRPFRPGVPALETFPFEAWARISGRRWRSAQSVLEGSWDPAGHPPLRLAIAEHLRAMRGLDCRPEEIVVVNGAQQGIHLAARALLTPGTRVACESPGYQRAWAALRAAGAEIQPVPALAAGDGLEPDRLEAAGEVGMVYVCPSNRFPLGGPVGLARRLQLLDWAGERTGWILEDDYDGEFVYRGRPLTAMRTLDRLGRVIYVGSFSKVLIPGLRLGYVVATPEVAARIAAEKMNTDLGSPVMDQVILADFMAEGDFARHLRRSRALYGRRLAALQEAVDRHLGSWVAVRQIHAGLHLTLLLPANTDDIAVSARLAGLGIETVPLSSYGRPDLPGLLLGFACVPEAEIEPAVRIMAEVLAGTRRSEPA